jgi:signal transduction histidine kinase
VRESINNAIKHGKPKYITVSCRVIADDELEVSVTNDGLPWVTTESGGAGIRALESVTTTLSVETEEAETTLRVSIPLAPVAS